jgi:hypothetical protein
MQNPCLKSVSQAAAISINAVTKIKLLRFFTEANSEASDCDNDPGLQMASLSYVYQVY